MQPATADISLWGPAVVEAGTRVQPTGETLQQQVAGQAAAVLRETVCLDAVALVRFCFCPLPSTFASALFDIICCFVVIEVLTVPSHPLSTTHSWQPQSSLNRCSSCFTPWSGALWTC